MNWLAVFPSTNGLCVTGITMALTTQVAVLTGWHPPEGWLLFILAFAGVSTAQFTGKRLTHFKDKPGAPHP